MIFGPESLPDPEVHEPELLAAAFGRHPATRTADRDLRELRFGRRADLPAALTTWPESPGGYFVDRLRRYGPQQSYPPSDYLRDRR